MSQVKAVLINFSKQDLAKIDKMVKEGFYASRTEFVRSAVRNHIQEHSGLGKEKGPGLQRISSNDLDKALIDYINEDPHERLRKLGLR
ncbi:MAG: hypothetical protein AB1467_00320 [Candidatus Diapherotrites archaeon]